MRGMTLVRRIKILFDVKGMKSKVSHRRDGEDLEVELFLQEETDILSLAGECLFCAQACQQCQRRLLKKIEDINGRTRDYKSGSGRLLQFACTAKRPLDQGTPPYVCGGLGMSL